MGLLKWTYGVLALSALFIGPEISARAQTVLDVRGDAFIAGKTPIDPPAGEARNSHIYITIKGRAAAEMFARMEVLEEADLCVTGNRLKRAGRLYCSVTPNRRNGACSFSINLRRGLLEDGQPC